MKREQKEVHLSREVYEVNRCYRN